MNCLNLHPELVCFGESLFWGREFARPDDRKRYSPKQVTAILTVYKHRKWSPGKGIGIPLQGKEEPLNSTFDAEFKELLNSGGRPKEVFEALARVFCLVHNKPMAIEKTPHHVHFLGRIRNRFPNARFIVMRRDPYDFVLSYKFQGGQQGPEKRSLFKNIYHPILCAIVCRKYLKSFAYVHQHHAGHSKFIDLDDLKSDPVGVFEDVFRFLEVEPLKVDVGALGKNSSFSDSGVRPQLLPADIFWLNLIAGNYIKSAGYKYRDSNASFGEVIYSLCSLPQVLLFVVTNAARLPGNQLKYLFRLLR